MNFTDPANFISLNSTTTAAPIAAFSFKGSFWEPQPLPGWDLDNGFFRAWWIDPLVASVSFIVFISWYWYHERRIGVSSVVKLDWKALNFHDSMPVLTGVSYWAGIYLWRIIIPPAATQLPDGLPSNLSEFVHMLLEVASYHRIRCHLLLHPLGISCHPRPTKIPFNTPWTCRQRIKRKSSRKCTLGKSPCSASFVCRCFPPSSCQYLCPKVESVAGMHNQIASRTSYSQHIGHLVLDRISFGSTNAMYLEKVVGGRSATQMASFE